MKLKTQKDIRKEFLVSDYGKEVLNAFIERERETAIKWVKFFYEQQEEMHLKTNKMQYSNAIEYFRNFFNITEENLKQRGDGE